MGFNVNKLKVQLKLAINRIKMLQAKKSSIQQHQRKEIAQLLEAGKVESAKIRVEHIIREDYNMEAMEMLELLCDLLMARLGLLELKQCDPSIQEAVHTLIYSASRSEVKELMAVRDQLVGRFGKEFAEAALNNRMGLVNPRVVQRLKVQTPDAVLVSSYLREIAKSFNVAWEEPQPELIIPAPMMGVPVVMPGVPAVQTMPVSPFPNYHNVAMTHPQPMTAMPASQHHPNTAWTPETMSPVNAPMLPPETRTISPPTVSLAPTSSGSLPMIPRLPDHSDDEADTGKPAVIAKHTGRESVPDFPVPPTTMPTVNVDSDTPDFDELARRFEELKRRK